MGEGFPSAAPRSRGIAAPRDVFGANQLKSLISQARATIQQTATEWANGNPNLQKGLVLTISRALDLYEKGKQLPLEMNLGNDHAPSKSDPAYS